MRTFNEVAKVKTLLRKERAEERFDHYVPKNTYVSKIGDKVSLKESQIKDSAQNGFKKSFVISEISLEPHNNSKIERKF